MQNIYKTVCAQAGAESLELLAGGRKCRVERIVSCAAASPEGFWYDQEEDEFVAVLGGEGVLEFEGGKTLRLRRGEHLLIKKHIRHRVKSTSLKPPCIWLAVFGDFS